MRGHARLSLNPTHSPAPLLLCVCAGPHRGPRVGADAAALPPGQVKAAQELQVEGVRAVEHGEAQDVGLVVHHVVQPQQREVLRTTAGRHVRRRRNSTGGVRGLTLKHQTAEGRQTATRTSQTSSKPSLQSNIHRRKQRHRQADATLQFSLVLLTDNSCD